jgi:hypothetical protein
MSNSNFETKKQEPCYIWGFRLMIYNVRLHIFNSSHTTYNYKSKRRKACTYVIDTYSTSWYSTLYSSKKLTARVICYYPEKGFHSLLRLPVWGCVCNMPSTCSSHPIKWYCSPHLYRVNLSRAAISYGRNRMPADKKINTGIEQAARILLGNNV